MGKAGRAFVEQTYSWDSIIARLSRILRRLASQPPGG
jgi:glycosyltransferase involved in cell wall biosynthesis